MPEECEAFHVRIGQRAEEGGIGQTEYGRVGTDAQSQSQYCDGGEAGRFAQHAEGETTIRENRIEPILNMRLANHFRILAPSAEEFPRLFQVPD